MCGCVEGEIRICPTTIHTHTQHTTYQSKALLSLHLTIPPTHPHTHTHTYTHKQAFSYMGSVVNLGYVKDKKMARLLSGYIGPKMMSSLVVSIQTHTHTHTHPHIISIDEY
jgi:hypothetical protein